MTVHRVTVGFPLPTGQPMRGLLKELVVERISPICGLLKPKINYRVSNFSICCGLDTGSIPVTSTTWARGEVGERTGL